MVELFIIACISGLITFLLIPNIIKIAFIYNLICTPKDKFVDVPKLTRKKSHNYSIPVIGGIAIYFPFLIVTLYLLIFRNDLFISNHEKIQLYSLLFGGSIIFFLGLLDDAFNISYKIRIIIQVITIIVFVLLNFQNILFEIPGLKIIHSNIIGFFILTIWLIIITNAVNFIDGLDGLATGLMLIALISLTILFYESYAILLYLFSAIIGASLVFLKYNSFPAKIFLGSSGTLLFGFIIGASAIWTPEKNAPIKILPFAAIILSVPLIDLFIVCMERIFHKMNPGIADSWHIHDRVLITRVERKHAAFTIYALGLSYAIIAFYYKSTQNIYIMIAATFFVFIFFYCYLLLKRYNAKVKENN